MRDPQRIERIIGLLRTYWQGNPDLRLGQLVANLHRDTGGEDNDPFHMEDDELEQQLRLYVEGPPKPVGKETRVNLKDPDGWIPPEW